MRHSGACPSGAVRRREIEELVPILGRRTGGGREELDSSGRSPARQGQSAGSLVLPPGLEVEGIGQPGRPYRFSASHPVLEVLRSGGGREERAAGTEGDILTPVRESVHLAAPEELLELLDGEAVDLGVRGEREGSAQASHGDVRGHMRGRGVRTHGAQPGQARSDQAPGAAVHENARHAALGESGGQPLGEA